MKKLTFILTMILALMVAFIFCGGIIYWVDYFQDYGKKQRIGTYNKSIAQTKQSIIDTFDNLGCRVDTVGMLFYISEIQPINKLHSEITDTINFCGSDSFPLKHMTDKEYKHFVKIFGIETGVKLIK